MADTNNLFKLITPFAKQMQEIEYMFNDLRQLRLLANATAAQLDGYGDILAVGRKGMTDGEYLAVLQNKIIYNVGCGQPNVILKYADVLFGGMANVIYSEPYPAFVRLQVTNIPNPPYLLQGIQPLLPVGVGLEVVMAPDDSLTFCFVTEGGHTPTGHGFMEEGYDESHGYTAGKLTERII